MKVFFVGDNRGAANWGRAASMALDELLTKSFQISGRVTGDLFNLATAEAGYVGTLMPPRYYRHVRAMLPQRDRRPYAWYFKLEHLFGARDFIDEDPGKSVDALLAHMHRHPALARICSDAGGADLVVLDGDGDIIFSTPPRRQTLFLLAMIELGLRLGKPVFLVNSMISDCPLTGRNTATLAATRRLLAQCRAVTLRDQESLQYVQREMPEANASFVPDSLFTWFPIYQCSPPPLASDFYPPSTGGGDAEVRFDFSQPYICLGGGALVASEPGKSAPRYARLVEALGTLGCRVCLTQNDISDGFLQAIAREKQAGFVPANAPITACGATLANARLFISGRYHPSILASLGGTPCIFLESHAHKMSSLARLLAYEENKEFSAFPDDVEIAAIVSAARQYLDRGDALRAQIRQVARQLAEEASRLPAMLLRHLNG